MSPLRTSASSGTAARIRSSFRSHPVSVVVSSRVQPVIPSRYLPVILSEAKDLLSRLSIFSEQIPRRCARAVAIAALARRRPRDDRVGVFARDIVWLFLGHDTKSNEAATAAT